MVAEKTKDKELLQLEDELKIGKASQAINSKHILSDNALYYLSKADSDPVIWFHIPEHLRKEVIEQYYDNNDHMGIDMMHSKQCTTGQIFTKTYINMEHLM